MTSLLATRVGFCARALQPTKRWKPLHQIHFYLVTRLSISAKTGWRCWHATVGHLGCSTVRCCGSTIHGPLGGGPSRSGGGNNDSLRQVSIPRFCGLMKSLFFACIFQSVDRWSSVNQKHARWSSVNYGKSITFPDSATTVGDGCPGNWHFKDLCLHAYYYLLRFSYIIL
jgi:hypothetical protein